MYAVSTTRMVESSSHGIEQGEDGGMPLAHVQKPPAASSLTLLASCCTTIDTDPQQFAGFMHIAHAA